MSGAEPLARRRPRVIAGVYAVRLVLAWLFALPIAGAVEATGLAQFPAGDALLFESSGLYLVETARVAAPSLRAYSRPALLALIPTLIALVLVRTAEFAALAERGRLATGPWVERTLAALPGFLLLSGCALLLKLLSAALGLGLALQVAAALLHTIGERASDLTGLALALSVLLLIAALTVAFDCARARVVAHRERALAAFGRAFRLLARRPGKLAAAWAGPTLASALAVAAVACVVPWLDVAQPSGFRVAGVFALHQLAALALVWFDAVWIAAALRLTTEPEPEPEPAGAIPAASE